MNENHIIDKENALRFAQAVDLLYSSFKELNKVVMNMIPVEDYNALSKDLPINPSTDKDL